MDTETTGVFLKKRPIHDPANPRMVSLAALGFTDDGEHEIAALYGLVRPDGFIIPDGLPHGITHDFAVKNGQDGTGVLLHFLHLAFHSRLIFAFNVQFDRQMIHRELMIRQPDQYDMFDVQKTRCAMLAAAACMKMPNKHGFPGYAWPKLGEAYEWLHGKKMEGAHNAMADVRATSDLVFNLRKLNYWDIENDRAFI